MFKNKFESEISSNTFNGECSYNEIGNNFYNNNFSGSFSYNKIGNYFNSNNIGDGFGFGSSTSQGNTIGNYFYSNNIGEYFYNNNICDGFFSNTVVDFFQLNDVKHSLSSIDFTTATHVYGNYNCSIFLNQTSTSRLSYYDTFDVLTIGNITD
jgi:hypothetical protein